MADIREEDFGFIKAGHPEHIPSWCGREEVLVSQVLIVLIMSLPTNCITLENPSNISTPQLPQQENGNNHTSSDYRLQDYWNIIILWQILISIHVAECMINQ